MSPDEDVTASKSVSGEPVSGSEGGSGSASGSGLALNSGSKTSSKFSPPTNRFTITHDHRHLHLPREPPTDPQTTHSDIAGAWRSATQAASAATTATRQRFGLASASTSTSTSDSACLSRAKSNGRIVGVRFGSNCCGPVKVPPSSEPVQAMDGECCRLHCAHSRCTCQLSLALIMVAVCVTLVVVACFIVW